MLRFLRRHSKWILAIFGTGLMIAFLIPFAIQEFSQAAAVSSANWATIGPDREKISAEELRIAQRDLQVLERLGLGVPFFGPLKDPAHWYLLVREADDAGMLGGRALDQIPPEQLALVSQAGGASAAELDRVLGRLNAVQRLISMYAGAGKFSDRRLRTAAARLFHAIGGRFLMLDAEAGDDAPMPSDEAIAAQFEKYRDVAEGAGEFGFGYQLPDRLKYEYVRITRRGIEAHIATADLVNPVTLRKHWIAADATAGLPAYEAGVPVPAAVESSMRRRVFDEVRTRILRYALSEIRMRQRHLPSPTGYFELPGDWAERRVQFPELATALQEEFPGLELPAYRSISTWETPGDMQTGDLAMDWLEEGPGRQGPARVAGLAREFGGDAAMTLQQGVMAPVVHGADDGIVLWRITDTEPAHAAATVDEVRDAIVRDLQRLAHYEELQTRAADIESRVRASSILAVGVEMGEVVTTNVRITAYDRMLFDFMLAQGQVPTQRASALPQPIGADADVVVQLIDAAMAAGEDTPEGQPIVFSHPVDDHMILLVLEIDSQEPLERERYDRILQSQTLQQIMLEEELSAADTLIDVFGYEELAARHQFIPERRNDDTEDADASEDGATDTEGA